MTGRATWSGSLTFGMVGVPIKLYLATEEHKVSFNQLHRGCGARIRMLKRCEKGHDVVAEEIVKGYEVSKDTYVQLEDEDFDALPLPSRQSVEIVRFVPQGSVGPEQYMKSYFVVPEKLGARGYALLVKAMETTRTWGIAKLAFRDTREHLALLRPADHKLMVHTLFWPDEVRSWPEMVPAEKFSREETGTAKLLVESMTGEYEPAMLVDRYREELLERIDAKLKGKPATKATKKKPDARDLMAALEASVAATKKKGGQRAS